MSTTRSLRSTTGSLTLLALCGALAAAAPVVAAQSYPSKPIRIIVTATAGGPPDILARWLAERLGPALGVPIVVDDRPASSAMSLFCQPWAASKITSARC